MGHPVAFPRSAKLMTLVLTQVTVKSHQVTRVIDRVKDSHNAGLQEGVRINVDGVMLQRQVAYSSHDCLLYHTCCKH
jgi:hypothetical protein